MDHISMESGHVGGGGKGRKGEGREGEKGGGEGEEFLPRPRYYFFLKTRVINLIERRNVIHET